MNCMQILLLNGGGGGGVERGASAVYRIKSQLRSIMKMDLNAF